MSSIPNSAMPHAGPQPTEETGDSTSQGRLGQLSDFGSDIAEMVREHPKTAIAAGAAVVGLAAAAAIPAIRGRRSETSGRSETKGRSAKKKS